VAKGVAAESQRLFAGGVLGVELRAYIIHEGGKTLGRIR